MKKKKTSKTYSILIVIFTLCVLVSSIILIYKTINNYKTKKEIENSKITEIITKETVEQEINYLKKKYNNNNDIVGIIKISEKINTPLVQATNNNYYLNHSLEKQYSIIGSVFMDYSNTTNDKQINIYGHNSVKFDPPFKELQNYLDYSYYENNKNIELKINNETRTYEIFSIYLAEKTSKEEHMKFKYSTNEQWLNHFMRMQKRSIHNNYLVLEETDNIIVLQTCLFGANDGKLLIIAAKEISF